MGIICVGVSKLIDRFGERTVSRRKTPEQAWSSISGKSTAIGTIKVQKEQDDPATLSFQEGS